MKITLGGIITPRMADEATTEVAREREYLYLFISGTATELMVAAVAVVEPQIAPKAVLAPMVARARPPGRLPITLYAAS